MICLFMRQKTLDNFRQTFLFQNSEYYVNVKTQSQLIFLRDGERWKDSQGAGGRLSWESSPFSAIKQSCGGETLE